MIMIPAWWLWQCQRYDDDDYDNNNNAYDDTTTTTDDTNDTDINNEFRDDSMHLLEKKTIISS